ncbi:MAG TPA: ABC transporter ATP-binding protein, partial [Clostridia bacterium]|nr:ABC transporter ATP-binding protein [Clostridia bacterium]
VFIDGFDLLTEQIYRIIVAHRLSTIMDADNIVLLENGQVAEQGTHAELLARSPLYNKLWDAHRESMDWDIGGA